jgi:hypothetical protein
MLVVVVFKCKSALFNNGRSKIKGFATLTVKILFFVLARRRSGLLPDAKRNGLNK